MTSDDVSRVIALLQRKLDEKMEASDPHDERGHEAFGFACGLAYAIGALENAARDE